jgi:hypothetical protein
VEWVSGVFSLVLRAKAMPPGRAVEEKPSRGNGVEIPPRFKFLTTHRSFEGLKFPYSFDRGFQDLPGPLFRPERNPVKGSGHNSFLY